MSGLVKQAVGPIIIGVGGLTSNVGKTTLVCQLLKQFPGWEAIKTTRGHYRSCGKDPHACCVSHLLEEQPVIRSGRQQTYEAEKDTGRYWEAGAANVHWVIATDEQIAEGVQQAVSRVRSAGVLIEGNSFTEHVAPNVFVMVARSDSEKIKATARKALERVSAFYISDERDSRGADNLRALLGRVGGAEHQAPIFCASEFDLLLAYARNGVGTASLPAFA
jgi:molybdopterin-guanine dinucleotide biosynthesis protein